MRIWLGADLTHLSRDVIAHAADTSDRILVITTPRMLQGVDQRLSWHAKGYRHRRLPGLLEFTAGGQIRTVSSEQLERQQGGHHDAVWLAFEQLELGELNRIVAWATHLARAGT